MANDSTFSRTLHDVGLAAWFGGSLMGAIGVNGAAAAIGGRDGARVAERGWSRWAPLQFAAVGAYAVGSLGLTLGNRGRLRHQPGVGSLAAAKTLVSVAAVGATAYAAYLGQQTADDPVPPVAPEDAAEAVDGRCPAVDEVRQRLGLLQWAVPVLTGALVVMSARMGEQQRAVERGAAACSSGCRTCRRGRRSPTCRRARRCCRCRRCRRCRTCPRCPTSVAPVPAVAAGTCPRCRRASSPRRAGVLYPRRP